MEDAKEYIEGYLDEVMQWTATAYEKFKSGDVDGAYEAIHDYAGSLDTIMDAMEEVDPGIDERMWERQKRTSNLPDFLR